jgi:hypothetical protein
MEMEFVLPTDAPSRIAGLAASRRKNYPERADNRTAAQTRGGSAPPAAKTKRRPSPKQNIRSIGRMFPADAWTLRSAGALSHPAPGKSEHRDHQADDPRGRDRIGFAVGVSWYPEHLGLHDDPPKLGLGPLGIIGYQPKALSALTA